MRNSRSWALGVALFIVIALLVVPAIVLAGRDSSATVRVDNPKGASAPPAAEQVRADRRDSFRHGGCSKRPEAFMASV
jgi:hypothetical protein